MTGSQDPVLGFVVPALDGLVTGGTLYNRELCAALGGLSRSVEVVRLDAPDLTARLDRARYVWLDSLYLDHVPELKRRVRCPVGLLTHYLPSFVALGRAALPAEVSREEACALLEADALLVTSDFFCEALGPLVAPQRSILVVPPGSRARLAAALPAASLGVHALLIGNLTPGKGIEPLLAALGSLLLPSDHFQLSIIGSLGADAAYAERCRRRLLDSPALARRVSLCGAQSPEETAAALARAELLVSASRMESYGMALAEARVVGVPILACAGGNARAHVAPEAGGQLVPDVPALARACLELARAPERLRERIEQARAHALPARSWHSAAQDFLDQFASLEK